MMRSRSLIFFALAPLASGFLGGTRPAAFSPPVAISSTVVDSEGTQRDAREVNLASPLSAALAERLFKQSLTPAPAAKAPARSRGQNPVVLGGAKGPKPKAHTVDKRRAGNSMDALFSSDLLDADQEKVLGDLTVELLRIEGVRDELLKERGQEELGERLDDNELEDELLGLNCGEFRAAWAARAGLASPQELTTRIRRGRSARQALVAANMRLVVAVAKRYAGLGMGLSDLVQEGSLGLMRAATKYDPARGCKFATYACWWIQQAILRAVAFQSRLIRLPMHVHQDLARCTRAARDFAQTHGREPSDAELADASGMSVDKLRRVREAARQGDAVSTESPRGLVSKVGGAEHGFGRRKARPQKGRAAPAPAPRTAGRTMKLEDTLASSEPEASKAVEMSLLHAAIANAFEDLEEDERRVMALRFGLEDGVPCSPAAVAERCGESKDWVRRCEMRALRKLRKPHHLLALQNFNLQRQSLTSAN